MSRKQDRNTRMAERRERKFDTHGIAVEQESHTEIRREGDRDVIYDFNFAVYRGARLIGRTFTHRSALKRGHQEAHNHPVSQARKRR